MTTAFSDFALPAPLLQALTRIQFTTPTPIQAQTLPLALEGKDILGSAQTGTGKTGAFGIPVIAGLMADPQATALILTPTRELAMQVMATMQQFIAVPTIRTALLIGGEPMPKQFKQINANPRLIVGTPGRVIDHLMRGRWNLNNTRYLVLDETDRMLDMGFGIQLDKILEYVPSERQTMMFSATLPANIVKMSAKYLKSPQRVSVGTTSTPAAKIKQEYVRTTEEEKYGHLIDQLEQRSGSVIIFVKTKYGAEKLATKLFRAEHKADAIHGDLKQNQRARVIQGFREKKYRILVATDVAARGLDIPHIEHVINYDLPQCPEDYIHRIGRTARAGAEGAAVNLVSPADGGKWKAIQRLLNPQGNPEDYDSSKHSGQNSRRFGNRNGGGQGERRPFGQRSERPFNDNGKRSFGGDRSSDNRFADPRSGDSRSAGNRSFGHRDDRPGNNDNAKQPRPSGERAERRFEAEGQGAPKKPGARKPFGNKANPFTKDNGFGRKPGGFKKKFAGARKSAA